MLRNFKNLTNLFFVGLKPNRLMSTFPLPAQSKSGNAVICEKHPIDIGIVKREVEKGLELNRNYGFFESRNMFKNVVALINKSPTDFSGSRNLVIASRLGYAASLKISYKKDHRDEAEKQYRQVLAIDPENEEAKKEILSIERTEFRRPSIPGGPVFGNITFFDDLDFDADLSSNRTPSVLPNPSPSVVPDPCPRLDRGIQ